LASAVDTRRRGVSTSLSTFAPALTRSRSKRRTCQPTFPPIRLVSSPAARSSVAMVRRSRSPAARIGKHQTKSTPSGFTSTMRMTSGRRRKCWQSTASSRGARSMPARRHQSPSQPPGFRASCGSSMCHSKFRCA
jgi:hypothetical protein